MFISCVYIIYMLFFVYMHIASTSSTWGLGACPGPWGNLSPLHRQRHRHRPPPPIQHPLSSPYRCATHFGPRKPLASSLPLPFFHRPPSPSLSLRHALWSSHATCPMLFSPPSSPLPLSLPVPSSRLPLGCCHSCLHPFSSLPMLPFPLSFVLPLRSLACWG